jgi:ABC-2 type transport system permease protein
MRTALLHGHIGWLDLLVLLAWAGVGATITARTFKWE